MILKVLNGHNFWTYHMLLSDYFSENTQTYILYVCVRIYRCTKVLHEYIHFKPNRTSSSSFYCPKNTVLTFYSTFNLYNCTLETVLKYLYLFFNL